MAICLVQPRSEQDWHQARALIEQYAASLELDLSFQNFAEELESLSTVYAPPRGAFLLARENRACLGGVGLRQIDKATGDKVVGNEAIGEIKRLYRIPTARGRGVGRVLAEAIIAKGKELGYGRLRLDTLPSMKAAQALYMDLGFRPIGAYRFNPVPGTVYLELRLR